MLYSNALSLALRKGAGFWRARTKFNWILSRSLTFEEPCNTKIITMAEVKKKMRLKSGIDEYYNESPKSRENLLQFERKIEDLPMRTMKDSYTSATIPLGNNPGLREEYISLVGNVRLGRLIEQMDLFAVWVVYQHLSFPGLEKIHLPYVIVTILVDKIDFTSYRPSIDKDIILKGHVCWVGRSSIEVKVWLEQEVDNVLKKFTSSYFLAACRNATNTKAAPVNPLNPENAEEEKIIKGGDLRAQRRKEMNKNSLFKVEPSPEEQQILHKFFQKSIDKDILSLNQHILPDNCRWLSDNIQYNTILSFPEFRNAQNTIFGGFLLRNAFEVSWFCAYLYGRTSPILQHTCDIEFKKPVSLSSSLKLTSYIAYTEKNYIQVLTVAEDFNLKEMESWDHPNKSNVFHFTFKTAEEIPKIIPKTYHEMMFYLEGRQKFKYATS